MCLTSARNQGASLSEARSGPFLLGLWGRALAPIRIPWPAGAAQAACAAGIVPGSRLPASRLRAKLRDDRENHAPQRITQRDGAPGSRCGISCLPSAVSHSTPPCSTAAANPPRQAYRRTVRDPYSRATLINRRRENGKQGGPSGCGVCIYLRCPHPCSPPLPL